MSPKVSSIKSYFTQVGLYTEWIKKKMASPDFCIGGAYANGATGGAKGGGVRAAVGRGVAGGAATEGGGAD